MNKPARKSVRARWIVLTGQFNSSSNKNYVGTKFSCLKYDLQCTNFEPDKTYNTTMYVRPAKTQVSLCIDPLDKASFLLTVRSVKGLNRMCSCSPGLPLTFRLRKSQTSYTSDLEVPQENLGSPTFSVLQQAALCFAKHRFLFQCHTESSWSIILSDVS